MSTVQEKNASHTPGPWAVMDAYAGEAVFSVPLAATSPRHTRQDGVGDYPINALVALTYGHHDADGNYSQGANQHLIAAAPDLLALAKQYASECGRCNGTGLVTISYGGDGYGDRCAALADADDQPCPDCEDIRKVLAKAEGRK